MPAIISASGPGKRASRPRTGEGTPWPELPRYTVDTTYSLPGGTEHVCTTAGEFTTALANCARGDVITLTAGNTFSGNFTLPAKSGTGWVYIRSSGLGSLPYGTRVTAANVANMAIISGTADTIRMASGASHWRLAGLKITHPSDQLYSGACIRMRDDPEQAVPPSHLIVDRCWLAGDATYFTDFGVIINGGNTAVIDCRIDNIGRLDTERQAILAYADGPYVIRNNYLEGAGENLMFGGGTIGDSARIASDITITGNHFYIPTAWAATSGSKVTIKNLLELKTGQRALIEGNRFENAWSGQGQAGFAVVFTPRNESGPDTWNYLRDITFRNNKFVNCCAGINIIGSDSGTYNSAATRRVRIHNNLMMLTGLRASGAGTVDNGGAVTPFQASGGRTSTDGRRMENLRFEHNTVTIENGAGSDARSMYLVGNEKLESFYFNDNLIAFGTYGVIGDALGGSGTSALNNYCDAYEFLNNAMYPISGVSANYPASTQFAATVGAVDFVNYTGNDSGDHRLDVASPFLNDATDGADIGCDVDAIDAALND